MESVDVMGNGCCRSQRKIIAHFDIRNTMIVADTITDIKVEQGLNAYLTGVLWGRETGNDWEWASRSPTLLPPEDGTTTYYKHLERMMVKAPEDRDKLRREVGDFVHTDIGSGFIQYYNKALKLLEWHHENDPTMTLTGNNGKSYHYILPAVYKLIQYLHDTKRDFCIIIRTYGRDCSNVLNSLSNSLGTMKHPQFPNLPNIAINPNIGKVIRSDNKIELKVGGVEGQIDDESAIYDMLSQTQGICGFQDDFLYWQENDYHHKCAKPLWVDVNDHSSMHIFFDDNYRPDTLDSIIDVRHKVAYGKWKSIDGKELQKYHNTSLVQVDLLEAIENEDYYIQKFMDCEKNYNSL